MEEDCFFSNYDLFSCLNGFTGEQCQNDICQTINCKNNGKCYVENNQGICR